MKRCQKCHGRRGDWVRPKGATISIWVKCWACAGSGRALNSTIRKRVRVLQATEVRP